MTFCVWIVLLYLIDGHMSLSVPSFVSQPNVVNSYRGQSTTLTWSLSEPVNSRWRYIGIQYEKPTKVTLLTFNIRNNYYTYGDGYDANRVRGDIKVDSTTISFTLFNLQPDDARYRYSCSVKYDTFKDSVINTNGWILLYGKIKYILFYVSLLCCINNFIKSLLCCSNTFIIKL
ncbi:hypothetical protein LSH36_2251g00002 [Paralvinella palmiformis]|uniref:Immunoglobulin V-set domain-containing protein n=1 Tax=Paralvinella palmiformis TaxID=53620 RepID=A0AAD9IQ18_9ANNE|nr:hypothetical protein LSH36_2251g00002 [Paralvinella palmiformis]